MALPAVWTVVVMPSARWTLPLLSSALAVVLPARVSVASLGGVRLRLGFAYPRDLATVGNEVARAEWHVSLPERAPARGHA